MKRGSECQIPEVIIPQPDSSNSASNTEAAFKEAKRLISEGEPVIIRLVFIYCCTTLALYNIVHDVSDLTVDPLNMKRAGELAATQ